MSKMSELDLCAGELRSAARSLTAVADSITDLFSGGGMKPDQKKSLEAKPAPITLEQVRSVLAEKSRGGHTAVVRALLERHGAAKLSEIDPAEYPALLVEGSQIGLSGGAANG